MNPIFLLTALFFTTLLVQAQTTTEKLYGFHQQVTPGIKRSADIDASGRIVKNEAPDVSHYYLYLTTSSKTKIYPIQLWINGQAYSVKIEKADQVPAVQANVDSPAGKAKPLLSLKNGQQLFQLTLIPLIANKSTSKGEVLASHNAAVLYYKKAGKFYYGVLKKFTELKAPSLQ